MQFPINELRNPICMEMRAMKPSNRGESFFSGAQEIGSIGSSDTYASCNTQPFNSQADLTEDSVFDPLLDNSNVYINPLQCHNAASKPAFSNSALRSLGASPLEESYKGFGPIDRGSRGSLNDNGNTKNWRARFHKVNCTRVTIRWWRRTMWWIFYYFFFRWISTRLRDWSSTQIREEGSRLYQVDRWLMRQELLISICLEDQRCLDLVRWWSEEFSAWLFTYVDKVFPALYMSGCGCVVRQRIYVQLSE